MQEQFTFIKEKSGSVTSDSRHKKGSQENPEQNPEILPFFNFFPCPIPTQRSYGKQDQKSLSLIQIFYCLTVLNNLLIPFQGICRNNKTLKPNFIKIKLNQANFKSPFSINQI